MKFKIVTSEFCTYCNSAKMIMKQNNTEYEEVDVMDAMDLMQQNNLKTVPQIFIDDQLLPGGYKGLREYFSNVS